MKPTVAILIGFSIAPIMVALQTQNWGLLSRYGFIWLAYLLFVLPRVNMTIEPHWMTFLSQIVWFGIVVPMYFLYLYKTR